MKYVIKILHLSKIEINHAIMTSTVWFDDLIKGFVHDFFRFSSRFSVCSLDCLFVVFQLLLDTI